MILRKMEVRDIESIYQNIHLKYIKKYFPKESEEQWKAHKNWYIFVINSPNYLFYIVENLKGEFLGTVRFELEKTNGIISVYLIEKVRGKGLSKLMILNSIEELKFEFSKIREIRAYILEENEISQKAFTNLGFLFKRKKNFHGVEHLLYVKRIYKMENLVGLR